MNTDPYRVLGVGRNASNDEIKRSIPNVIQKVSVGQLFEQSALRYCREKNG